MQALRSKPNRYTKKPSSEYSSKRWEDVRTTITKYLYKYCFNIPDKKCIWTAAVSFFKPNKPCHITGNLRSKSSSVSVFCPEFDV